MRLSMLEENLNEENADTTLLHSCTSKLFFTFLHSQIKLYEEVKGKKGRVRERVNS